MEAGRHIPSNILYMDNITVSFDGFKALNALSLVVAPGELRAIIGPNGAGKTTMMDVITGKVRPDSGEVFFRDTIDLTQHDEAEIANLGIGRKFQKPTVIESLSVAENLDLAIAGERGVFATLFSSQSSEQRARIDEIVELVGLADKRRDLAGSLSHGQKQWLEIGMLIIQEPELMLVDEPAAGMTDHETELTAQLLRDISGERS
ncbi:MAG TPA: ABC transporter ATP-binding protein, partial [Porticoccaceae bacterium]|nr:ABC transporter ATP-binding protein [Porticoccaceae bacterium]